MNIILLGPQGSGKGTQAQLLAQRQGFVHLEMGRILRSVANSDNQHAQIVRETIDKGDLVPDEYVRLIAWDFINKHEPKTSNFEFEGYPRTALQYDQVKDMFMKFGKKITAVINIEISELETVKRLSARRTCEKCGEVYNLITHPSTELDKCDKCAGKLILREDDYPEAIKRRLQIYRTQTQPVFEKARSEGIGFEINGEQDIESIYQQIVKKLGI